MKLKFYYPILILFLFTNCKKEVSATLNLKIELENRYSSDYPDLVGLRIYKNGKLFKKYAADKMPYINHEITLNKLPSAKYEFEYQNFFHQTIRKSLFINKSTVYNVLIYPDYCDYKKNLHKSIIGKLKNGESMTIKFESQGCFSSGKDSVDIIKSNGKYFLKIDKNNLELKEADINYLKKTEAELYELPNNIGCSTIDTYTLIFKGRKRIHGNTANKIVEIGKKASPELVKILDNPEKGIIAHFILCKIWQNLWKEEICCNIKNVGDIEIMTINGLEIRIENNILYSTPESLKKNQQIWKKNCQA